MELDEYRGHIFTYLKNITPGHLGNLSIRLIVDNVFTQLNKNGVYSTLYLEENEKEKSKIREMVWSLIIERVLTPGLNSLNPELEFLSITEYGNKVLEAGEILPHDPEGYITKLKTEIPSIDPIIIIYITESLQAYLKGLIFSSAVTLGVASERVILLLLETLVNTTRAPAKIKKFKRIQNLYSIKDKHKGIKDELNHIKNSLPEDLKSNFDPFFEGIFHIFRITRNEAGHPTGKIISKYTAYGNLILFIPYCKLIYGIIEWLKTNPL